MLGACSKHRAARARAARRGPLPHSTSRHRPFGAVPSHTYAARLHPRTQWRTWMRRSMPRAVGGSKSGARAMSSPNTRHAPPLGGPMGPFSTRRTSRMASDRKSLGLAPASKRFGTRWILEPEIHVVESHQNSRVKRQDRWRLRGWHFGFSLSAGATSRGHRAEMRMRPGPGLVPPGWCVAVHPVKPRSTHGAAWVRGALRTRSPQAQATSFTAAFTTKTRVLFPDVSAGTTKKPIRSGE